MEMLNPDEAFVNDQAEELARARAKFPGPNKNFAAMVEEVGDVAKALLDFGLGKITWREVQEEAIQVAVMAQRIATEGDPTLVHLAGHAQGLAQQADAAAQLQSNYA